MPKPKPDSLIAKQFKAVLRRDVLIALIILIPVGFIVYGVFHWVFIRSKDCAYNTFLLSISLVIVGVVLEFANWRCPKCHRYIGMVYRPRFCPRCGVRFR
ncbi:hypothetical protein JW752_00495 [Candidatus Peregrinibacteria bacterium]|nr:hypothetical protein [Candidatus Peregrinibacteria bacterium]